MQGLRIYFLGKYSLREISSFFCEIWLFFKFEDQERRKNDDEAIEDKLLLMHYEIASILRNINIPKRSRKEITIYHKQLNNKTVYHCI